MNNRPTPETDAAEFPVMTWPKSDHPMVVRADFARTLERERDEWRKKAVELCPQRDEALRLLEKWEQVAIGAGERVLELTKQREKLAQTLQSLQVACFRIGRGDVNDVGAAVTKMRQKALEALNDLEGGKQ